MAEIVAAGMGCDSFRHAGPAPEIRHDTDDAACLLAFLSFFFSLLFLSTFVPFFESFFFFVGRRRRLSRRTPRVWPPPVFLSAVRFRFSHQGAHALDNKKKNGAAKTETTEITRSPPKGWVRLFSTRARRAHDKKAAAVPSYFWLNPRGTHTLQDNGRRPSCSLQ